MPKPRKDTLSIMNIKKFIIASLLGGLVVFMWNSISWTLLPFHAATLKTIPEQSLNREPMRESMPEAGIYHYPGYPKDDSQAALDAVNAKGEAGPLITLMVYKPSGTEEISAQRLAVFFLITVLSAGLATFLLAKVSVKKYLQRVMFVTLLGVFVSLTYLIDWYWFNFPADFIMLTIIDAVVAWFLAGLVIAKVVKPQAAKTAKS